MKQLIATLERTADGAMLVDHDGKITVWNRAAERLLGYRAEEVIGHPCHAVMHGETLSGHPLCSASCPIGKRIAFGRAVRNFDMQTRTKTGRVIWLNVSSLPVPARTKDRFLVAHLFRDITRLAKVRHLAEEVSAAICHFPGAEGPGGQPNFQERRLTDPLPEVPRTLALSGREREVLSLLAGGEDTKSIADRLCISPATVRNHIKHIFEKLGAHNRLQALAIAFRPGTPLPPRNL